MGVGQWGEQSGWTAGKQPGAGSSLRQPKLGLTPAAPCPPHSPLPGCRKSDSLGLKFGKGMGRGRAEPVSTQEGGVSPEWERAPAGTSQTGEPYSHLLLGKQAQKGSSNGFITQAADLLISHLALTPACPTLDALYVSPGVGRHGKFQFWAL